MHWLSETLGVRLGSTGNTGMKWRDAGTFALLLVGLTQMTGDLFGNRVLKGIGAATAMAPCPKVFCEMNGLEPFASSFALVADGEERKALPITPELYSRLRGPYNRRNVYGAAIAAAPRLPERVRRTVFNYAFSPGGPLQKELNLPRDTDTFQISLVTKTRGRNQQWMFRCTD